jgi:HTH-type transcriptional regulator/antitoxin HigA
MGIKVLDRIEYGKLCAATLPTAVENDKEFDRLVAEMERLDFKEHPTPEEEALSPLLMVLIQAYDDKIELPKTSPGSIIRHLMERSGLKQADLLPVFGSRSVAWDVINGKREASKAHIRKLAEFFHVSPAIFL